MKKKFVFLLLLFGAIFSLQAQDKLVLRNGRTIEVYVQRIVEDDVEYVYPGETPVYKRPKSAISYIQYENGRKDVFDEGQRSQRSTTTSRTTPSDAASSNRSTSSGSRLSNNDEIFWQDVKTTFMESEVSGMTRLKRVNAVSSISYKDAVQQLKKKAAAIGGTTILIMDVPENDNSNDIEIMGIAYRDESMEYTPKTATERNNAPVESPSNVRRRRIAQQMESYNNESNLRTNDNTNKPAQTSRGTSSSQRNTDSRSNAASSQTDDDNSPDALYLISGRVIKGTIEEFEPDDFVSIRTAAGKIYEYSMDDVKRVSRGRSSSTSARTTKQQTTKKPAAPRRQDTYEDDYSSSTGGYKGTFDLGYSMAVGGTGEKGSFEVNTSHGFQINDYLFVGAGVGLHVYNARDPLLKANMGTEKYPQYVNTDKYPMDSVTYMHAIDSSFYTLPIFVDIRGYLPLANPSIVPFAMLRIGYAFNLSDGFGGMGMYMNPAIGIKYQMTNMIGATLSLGYSYQGYGGIPQDGGYGFYYIKDKSGAPYEAQGAGCFTLKLGIEF
ncbi:MAG: hypothetical protein LBT42_03510 [Tannerella sp.]|jgi:hypothetical protein|nr:hypothetical protein [Tannerella sp.]